MHNSEPFQTCTKSQRVKTKEKQAERLTRALRDAGIRDVTSRRELEQSRLLNAHTFDGVRSVMHLLDYETEASRIGVSQLRHHSTAVTRRRGRLSGRVRQARRHFREHRRALRHQRVVGAVSQSEEQA